ncbi:undecaprenyldiphospho-muramoylpentapeptide beta-N-acetylglucosaminyltransferase [Candidatus Poribacteria bacterium]|nr:undecaprenyldiphospho-muramoylpentapeptide beta-N-acetylglucosaminyltransferase [Candidatus Poribacteria bacterium]
MKNQNTRQKRQDTINEDINKKIHVKRFVFAGGGTGGHIYPAVGIAQALQRLNPEIDLVFIGGRDRLESTLVPQQGFNFLPITVEGFPRSLTLKWIPVIIKTCQGLLQSLKYLKQLKPEVVIGTGGYVSGPVLFAAWLMDIPIAIQEQNVSPGLTNSILARWAEAAYLALPPNNQRFPEHIIQVTGNPIRPGITEYPRNDETYNKYNLSPLRKTVFVMGGSQGARAINEVMIDACPLIAKFATSVERVMNRNSIDLHNNSNSCNIQIVHQTGKSHVEEVRDAYDQHGIPHHVQSFFNTVEEIYSITDVMICRAGGMTVSEVTACGIPAIFIPLPAAIGNNQVINAKSVADSGAAVVLEQNKFTPEDLVGHLINILTEEETYQQMRAASKDLGRPFACDTIAESLYKLTNAL